MVKCRDCKLLKDIRGKKGICYGFKVPDARVNIECKFFQNKFSEKK